ncbi:MAG: hypothetical protein PHZ24_05265 [Bacteroidales bacterium]|nr:hypothetical protein [Bacteroidales bacterium]
MIPKINDQMELEIYAIEAGNKCANDMGGDFGEDYYIYFEGLFGQTINKLNRAKMSTQLLDKIDLIINKAFEGYRHKDAVGDLWADYKENK